jgi:hypothetical protein
MAKNNWPKSGEFSSKILRHEVATNKVTRHQTRTIAGAALTQRVGKALRSANTQTQTFKPKNAR